MRWLRRRGWRRWRRLRPVKDDELAVLRRELRRVFLADPGGASVLAWLVRTFGYETRSTAPSDGPLDVARMAFREGQRSVIVWLRRQLEEE